MLEKLTPEQEKIMYQTRDEWTNLLFDNIANKKGIDKPVFEECVNWIYNDLLHKPSPRIVYCDSWISCLLTIAILKEINNTSVWASVGDSVWASVGDSVRDSVRASVGDSVRASVRASVWASVGDSVWASVGDSVRDSVWDSVGDSVWASVWDSVGDSVRDSVRDSVGDSVRKCFNEYSSYISILNYGWVAFYDFFNKINVFDNFKYNQYKKLLKSGVFNAYEYENIVFAIQPPVYIERNTQGNLHSTTTAAVKFKDGNNYYFINGRSIPSWVIEEKDAITKEKFINETNSDIKGAIYEVLGTEGMMKMLGAEVIDTKNIHHANGEEEIVELLKTKDTFPELDNMPLAWIKMICPSTGTTYLQGVEPKYTDAIEAIASLSPFTKEEYSFNYRS